MELETGVTEQPPLDGRGLVGGVVVHDHVHDQVVRDAAVDEVQESLELLGPMPSGHIGDDLSGGHVEGGVEVGGAVADVVMAAPLGHAGHQRQHRSGPIQHLDLRVGSDQGAVLASRLARFPGPPADPVMAISRNGSMSSAWLC